jgi:high affinity Mn2+ porin
MSLEHPKPRLARAGLLSVAAVLLSTGAAAAAADRTDAPADPAGAGTPAAATPAVAIPAPANAADRAAQPAWWTAAFQSTYVWQRKPSFAAPYSGPKSLEPTAENGYTLTATLFVGVRPWPGAELFVNPEVIQSQELSHLAGLAGLSNGEAQKSGGPEATLYRARAFLRQTLLLGGEESTSEPGPNQLGGRTASRRLVLTAGNFSVADVFDGNAYAHDPRTQFLNWSLMAYGASDYAADVRGYTWGVALELYLDDWAFRLGRFAQPRESNGLALDANLLAHHGDSLEIERAHELLGRRGKLRVAGFRNFARMGSFADALGRATASGGAPDVADVRRNQAKWGFGAGLEQELSPDVGAFARYSWNDGRTETYAFTEIERSLMGGVSVKGTRWRREQDTVGVAFAENRLSSAHRRYVEAGGAGLFLGDGGLRYRPERILEAYYGFQASPGLWFSLDAQRIENPAYNADRGPVSIVGCRFHVEH